jgi:class 3 adenylate cyclase
MEPQIRYAKTSDGVSIAYWTLGQGDTPLVLGPPHVLSHIGLEWEDPQLQSWYQHLAERRLIVRYDSRGNGLSERNVADCSLESSVHDLQAVVDRLSLQRLALIGFGGGTPVAMAYAAQFPKRVARLVLKNPMARTSDVWDHPAFQEVLPLLEKDWRLFTETAAHVTMGWERGREAHDWARFMRRAVTQDDFKRALAAKHDASPYLHRIEAPTLLLQSKIYPIGMAQEVASKITGARLVQFAGVTVYLDTTANRAIDEFLFEGDTTTGRAATLPQGTAIILFADIADSTALTERLGDAAFREKARELDEALRRAITSNGGTAIDGKLLGDGVLATFGAAREAIACAMAIQRMAGSRVKGQGSSPDDALLLHVGIHAGDVIRESNNVYGGAVNIASRVAGEAAAGETLVSATVRDLARTSAGVSFEDRGERELKGVGEPVRVFAVREQD